MIEQKSDIPMEAVADESTVRRPTDRIEARNAGAIVAIGCGAPSDEVPAHCLRACLQGDPALLSSHGCNWLRRAAEGVVDVSDVNDGRCCQGFDVAAQRVDVGGQPVVLLSVEEPHDRVGTDACEAAVRATANAAGKLVGRVGQVLDENTGLIGEVLRSYEQLNFIFDLTREVSRISDAAELEQVLLCRLGDLLALDCIYVLGANGSRRRYDLPSDCVTEAATGLPLEHDLSDDINRVRKTGKVCATTVELRDVILGPLKRLDERTDVVLAARIEGNDDAVVQTRRFSGSGLCGGPQVVCCGKGAGRWWLIETLAGRGRGGFRLGERKTSAGRPYAAWRVASRAARIQRRMLRAMNLSFTVRSTAGWPRTRRRPPP